ncbi:UNVERIFIED_CONTAM: Kelch-like protein 4 [Gekko kuhli]
MSVSGKKEFDVKQILRLRWRWFSHPSQSSTGTGGCLQQEGYEHRGTPVQNRLKSHSRDRNGLKKNNSPIHHNILAPVPSPTPIHHRPIQTWHEQSLIEHLQATENTPEAGTEENCEKDQSHKPTQDPQMITEDHSDESIESKYAWHSRLKLEGQTTMSLANCGHQTSAKSSGAKDDMGWGHNAGKPGLTFSKPFLLSGDVCSLAALNPGKERDRDDAVIKDHAS